MGVAVEQVFVENETDQVQLESAARGPEYLNATVESAAVSSDPAIQQLCWQIIRKANSQRFLSDQLRQFVNVFCRTLGVDQVIAICKSKNRSAVQAVSGTESFDPHSRTIQELEQLADSQLESSLAEYWSSSPNESIHSSLLESYSRSNGFKSSAMLPMVSAINGQVIGHIAIFSSAQVLNDKQIQSLSDELFPVLAGQIDLAQRANGNRVSRFLSQLGSRLFQQNKTFWAVIAVVLGLILAFPASYQVNCDSSLQPTSRRYVASPFDGRLKQSLVEPGATVKKSQVLAVIDGEEFRLKLESANAEFKREKEKNSSALQEGRIADAQIAAFEMEKLETDIALYEQKIRNLKIKSPVDGLVVTGDLEKSVGAPLEKGQTLFEIGPIDQLNIEIEIPESEVRFVECGQEVIVRFHAFPLRSFNGTIENVFPRAEIKNDQAVFVAIAKINNDSGLLRPGMNGAASIDTGLSFVGWNLFHRPVERIRSWVGY